MSDNTPVIAAVARSEELADRLLRSGRNVLLCGSEGSELLDIGTRRRIRTDSGFVTECFDELDIVEYRRGEGIYLLWDNDSVENTVITSQKCNSSCVMCPYSDNYRANAGTVSAESILQLVKYIADPPPHITVSGGEPTLIGSGIFDIMGLLKKRFPYTQYLFLTNGRVFSCADYAEKFLEVCPDDICFGIPIYGFSPDTHDAVTRADGSFTEAVRGMQTLMRNEYPVEIRIVVSRLNCDILDKIAEFIAKYLRKALVVNFIGLEMCGNAARNRERVWLGYDEAFGKMKSAIDILCSENISAGIYNFPLCAVDKKYRGLCKRSISGYKIVYDEKCGRCSLKEICGGIFRSTYLLEHPEVNPVTENDRLF